MKMKIYETNKMEESEECSIDKDSKENLIKIKEIPILQTFYEQIICTMSESNRLSLEALNLVQELSSRIKDKSDELSLGFTDVSNPLSETLKCISLTLKGLHELGNKMIEIDEDSNVNGDHVDDLPLTNEDWDREGIKNEIKKEENQELEIESIPEIKEEVEYTLDDKNYILDKRTTASKNTPKHSNKSLNNGDSQDYSCNICDYTTSEPRYLKYHKQRHASGKYKCVECDYVAHRPYIVKVHMKNRHDVEDIEYLVDSQDSSIKYYLCSHGHNCSFLATSQEEMETHVNKKHENEVLNDAGKQENNSEAVVEEVDNKEYQCNRCDYTTKKKIYFDDHISGGLKYWRCAWCDDHLPFKQRGRFTVHLTTKHNIILQDDKLKCLYCDKLLDNSRKFLFHIGKEHGIGTMIHCNQCDYSSISRSNYKYHVSYHDTASFPCPECGYMAQNKTRLAKHLYERHQGGYCKICNKSFKDKIGLFNHNKTHHGQGGEKGNFFCDQCGRGFSTKGSLGTHLKGVHGSEKLQCEKCEYITYSQSGFRAHMEARHGEAKYLCEKCDYRSKTASKLTWHKQTVHGNARANCDICGQEFAHKLSLNRHIKTKHNGTPPSHKCTEPGCNYATHTPFFLKTHVAKVHEGIRWPCDLCDYVGGYKGDLNRHKKIVHDGFILECSQCEFKTPKKYTLKEHLKLQHGLNSIEGVV